MVYLLEYSSAEAEIPAFHEAIYNSTTSLFLLYKIERIDVLFILLIFIEI